MGAFAFTTEKGDEKAETTDVSMPGLVRFIEMFRPIADAINDLYMRSAYAKKPLLELPFRCLVLGEPDICIDYFGDKYIIRTYHIDRTTVAEVDAKSGTVSFKSDEDERIAERVREFMEKANSDPTGTLVETIRRLHTAFIAVSRVIDCTWCYNIIALLEDRYMDLTGEALVADAEKVERYAELYRRLYGLLGAIEDVVERMTRDEDFQRWPMYIAYSIDIDLPAECAGEETNMRIAGMTHSIGIVDGKHPLDVYLDMRLDDVLSFHMSRIESRHGRTESFNAEFNCFECVDRYERALEAAERLISRIPNAVKKLVTGLPRPIKQLGKPKPVVAERYYPLVQPSSKGIKVIAIDGNDMKRVIEYVGKHVGSRMTLMSDLGRLIGNVIRIKFTEKGYSWREDAYLAVSGRYDEDRAANVVYVETSITDYRTSDKVTVDAKLEETAAGVKHTISQRVNARFDRFFYALPWAADAFIRGVTLALEPGTLVSYVDGIRKELCHG